jgi:hypothetical protein
VEDTVHKLCHECTPFHFYYSNGLMVSLRAAYHSSEGFYNGRVHKVAPERREKPCGTCMSNVDNYDR